MLYEHTAGTITKRPERQLNWVRMQASIRLRIEREKRRSKARVKYSLLLGFNMSNTEKEKAILELIEDQLTTVGSRI